MGITLTRGEGAVEWDCISPGFHEVAFDTIGFAGRLPGGLIIAVLDCIYDKTGSLNYYCFIRRMDISHRYVLK